MVLRPSDRRREGGMTLVEVLVAAVVLGLALLALAPMFTSAVRINASAYQLTNSNTLAREKLEELSGYPRSDPRLVIATGSNAAGPPGTSISGAIVDTTNPWCRNDLPSWYNPEDGTTSTAATRPGPAWFPYPYTRTYTIEQFNSDSTVMTRVVTPAPYVVKLITVTVRPTSGPFPGLRESRQALYLRVKDA
ncbi:MAG TPA: prepilin-type N-terminal cleavage/methylation domain-containing protein [Thermoanaerobaculia bacterium]|nr:prepilin-type N-terminal cleavage/methylation domain-containing protein [Thermoanaerobaculia bacterium]